MSGCTQKEYNALAWMSALQYPEEVVAAFGRALRAERIPKYAPELEQRTREFKEVCAKRGLEWYAVWRVMGEWHPL